MTARADPVAAPHRPVLADVPSQKARAAGSAPDRRRVAIEVPVAFVFDGGTQAVMMATPADLECFGYGFSLNEGIVSHPGEITRIEIIDEPVGIEIRMWLQKDRSRALAERRRHGVGPTGCGLCGIDSLSAVRRVLNTNQSEAVFSADEVFAAMNALSRQQVLNAQTHAVHAAGLWRRSDGLKASFEDVGRHNALDKLAGHLALGDIDAAEAIIILTSRVSIEMVQKVAMIGAPVVAAISAPTALAIEVANEAGITLVGVARSDSFEIFTHPARITGVPTK